MSQARSSDDGSSDSSALDAEMIGAARREVEGADKPEGPNGLTLSTPGAARAFAVPPADSFAGYKIVREIHRGGQGVVYQAIQQSTKRKVAIKVMKEGPFAGSSDRARFDREVQVLGQLNHPNIVAIHDTGSAAGSFFFVMDYISGQPLDVFMASGERTIDETLKLFSEICEAVNAAHLRGIIHRDLKPGNIRVDAEGKPHVLDFGLAKVATTAAEASMMTMTGQFVGSLPWASPEQAEGAPGKIDVRTDVYSLGVVLYQMLTRQFPYEVVGNMRDVLDRIMREAPARPSTIRKQVNDEVETIVLKCLNKERDRRYQTAGELGRDIGHYLKGEPIEAKRDSFGYMMRKQLKRYRVPVAIAAGFVLVLTVGFLITLTLWRQTERQRGMADAARQAEAEQRQVAEAARDEALDAQESLERQTYAASIAAADAALRQHAVAAARAHLIKAPTNLRGWEWYYLAGQLDQSTATLYGHVQPVIDAAFSPDGSHIASVSPADGTLRIWDAETLAETMVIHGVGTSSGGCLAFSPDGTRVVAHVPPDAVGVFDIETGERLRLVSVGLGAKYPLGPLRFSPDGTRLFVGGETNKCFDPETGDVSVELDGHQSFVMGVAFSPDGAWIATGGLDRIVHLWNANSGKLLWKSADPEEMISALAFSPNGELLAAGLADRTIRVFDTTDRTVVRVLTGHDAMVTSVDFDSTGERLASSSMSGEIAIWSAQGRRLRVLHGHQTEVFSVRFSPDGTRLLSAGSDGTLKLWDARAEPVPAQLRQKEQLVERVPSPDGERAYRICTGSMTDTWGELVEVATGEVLSRQELSTDTLPYDIEFSRDSRMLALTRKDGTITFVDALSGGLLRHLRGHADWVMSCAFSPDGRTFVSGSRDGHIRVWDIEQGIELRTLGATDGYIRALAFSSSGKRFAAVGDKFVRLFDTQTQAEIRTLPLSAHLYVADLCFMADDRRLVCVGQKVGGGFAPRADTREARPLILTVWDT
ncbi:MAG: protein kinase, partial [Planctomycetota bacterium]